jgi:hypothetical protein
MHALPSPLRFHWRVTALAALAALVIVVLAASTPNLAGGRGEPVSPLASRHGVSSAAPAHAAKVMWLSHPLMPPTVELSTVSSTMSTTVRASATSASANPGAARAGRPRAAWP